MPSSSRPAAEGLRIVFAGTPDFAAHHLQALLDSHHQIIAVYSNAASVEAGARASASVMNIWASPPVNPAPISHIRISGDGSAQPNGRVSNPPSEQITAK